MNYKLYCFWHIRLHLLALDEVQRSMVTVTHVPIRRYGDFLMWLLTPLEKDKGLCTALCTDTWHVQRRWRQVQRTPSLLLRKAAFEMGVCSKATVETAPMSPAHPTVTFSYPDSSKGKHKLPLTNSKMNTKTPAWSQHNLHIQESLILARDCLETQHTTSINQKFMCYPYPLSQIRYFCTFYENVIQNRFPSPFHTLPDLKTEVASLCLSLPSPQSSDQTQKQNTASEKSHRRNWGEQNQWQG